MLIDQRQNFAGDFGLVFRSSATFWYRYGPGYRTTLSLLDYWQLKRGIKVALVASVRAMDGTLLKRERLTFERGAVINYAPSVGGDSFEGSVEIEAFSAENLVIPYAAVTGIYETARGVTMVHSYTRSYSRHEVEEGRTITNGHEGCWTLRDTEDVRSFAVVHNGPGKVSERHVTITVRNAAGETDHVYFSLPREPYATTCIQVADHWWRLDRKTLAQFLGGKPGSATAEFELGDAFTRMLIGHERVDGTDMQVTHSNFDYSRHETDMLPADTVGYMRLLAGAEPVVYPDRAPGVYNFQHHHAPPRMLTAKRIDGGGFPSRLVTGVTGNHQAGVLPYECSLGVITKQQPPKRFWWGTATASSRVFVHDLPEVYGGMQHYHALTLSLYRASSDVGIHAELSMRALNALDHGLPLEDLWPRAAEHLGGEPGYYVMQSDYGGLTCYSTLENEHGSMCLEHGF